MIELSDFPRLAALTAPHIASEDACLPMLHGIRVEFDGAYLYAIATDRYTFAIARQEPAERTPERWATFLTAADLRAIRALTPPRYQGTTHLTWDPKTRRLTVAIGEHALTLPDRTEQADKFPKWRPIVADAIDHAPNLTADLAVQPTYLARFTKVRTTWDHTPLTVWGHDPAKPVVLAHGPDFLGLLMPVRLDTTNGKDMQAGHAFIRAAWATALHGHQPEQQAA